MTQVCPGCLLLENCLGLGLRQFQTPSKLFGIDDQNENNDHPSSGGRGLKFSMCAAVFYVF